MALLQVVATMQMFTESKVLTGGGPENSTTTIVYLVYNYAFAYYRGFNKAAAMGVLMFLVLAVFSILYVIIERRGSED